jgi:predicted nucleotidyltransferase
MANPNLGLLLAMAHAMGDLRKRVVFVGGCATGLLVTNMAVTDVRSTEDVDAIMEIVSLPAYHGLRPELSKLGFVQTMQDNTPPFRWRLRGMQLDLVPLDEKVLGFANPWYRAGFANALTSEPEPGLVLRHLSAPYFLATKFEAFKDRGHNDVYLSHDLEDIITVVDGRVELLDEIAQASTDVKTHIVSNIRALVAHPEIENALPGIILRPIRASIVLQRLRAIALLETT